MLRELKHELLQMDDIVHRPSLSWSDSQHLNLVFDVYYLLAILSQQDYL